MVCLVGDAWTTFSAISFVLRWDYPTNELDDLVAPVATGVVTVVVIVVDCCDKPRKDALFHCMPSCDCSWQHFSAAVTFPQHQLLGTNAPQKEIVPGASAGAVRFRSQRNDYNAA